MFNNKYVHYSGYIQIMIPNMLTVHYYGQFYTMQMSYYKH